MNKARFEAIEAERLSDPMKFAIHANVYWMEARETLLSALEEKCVKEPEETKVKAVVKKKEPKKVWKSRK